MASHHHGFGVSQGARVIWWTPDAIFILTNFIDIRVYTPLYSRGRPLGFDVEHYLKHHFLYHDVKKGLDIPKIEFPDFLSICTASPTPKPPKFIRNEVVIIFHVLNREKHHEYLKYLVFIDF